jgi:hypothetical protein
MPRPPNPRRELIRILAALRTNTADLVEGVGTCLRQMGHLALHVRELKEQMMANFDGLQGDINELKQTVAETAARIERRLDEVMDDSVDQAATDAAAAEIREATAALKGIAPDPINEEDDDPVDDPDAPQV